MKYMIVTWTVEGVNWSENIKASIKADPCEIATRGVELAIESLESEEDSVEFGAIIRAFHSKMKDEGGHWILFAPQILANAGYHEDAKALRKAAEELL